MTVASLLSRTPNEPGSKDSNIDSGFCHESVKFHHLFVEKTVWYCPVITVYQPISWALRIQGTPDSRLIDPRLRLYCITKYRCAKE
jgi:hypothetical protein